MQAACSRDEVEKKRDFIWLSQNVILV
jgi:hypothetical protein